MVGVRGRNRAQPLSPSPGSKCAVGFALSRGSEGRWRASTSYHTTITARPGEPNTTIFCRGPLELQKFQVLDEQHPLPAREKVCKLCSAVSVLVEQSRPGRWRQGRVGREVRERSRFASYSRGSLKWHDRPTWGWPLRRLWLVPSQRGTAVQAQSPGSPPSPNASLLARGLLSARSLQGSRDVRGSGGRRAIAVLATEENKVSL